MPLVDHDIDAAAITDPGLKRTVNEDCYQLNKSLGFFLVADGMGGHSAGAMASRMAVTIINDILKDCLVGNQRSDSNAQLKKCHSLIEYPNNQKDVKNFIERAVRDANNTIYALNREHEYPDGAGMGTTFAGLCMTENNRECTIFHVGDCRVYLCRHGVLRQLTQDHTLYQILKKSGRQEPLPGKNIILRAIGPWPHVDVEIHALTMQANDTFLICSDGLIEMMDDAQILDIIQDRHYSLEKRCKKMVAMANEGGGLDNITVALVQSPAR